MQRFSRRWLTGWAAMALFAMMAVLASPALAFACCCGQETAPVPTPVASHPGCHGHAEADDAQDASKSRASVSSALDAAPVAASAPLQGPHFHSLCRCEHAGQSVAAFIQAQNTSPFSPLVLSVAVRTFSPAVNSPSSFRFAFASNTSKPRGPDTASRSGRAPPALSL